MDTNGCGPSAKSVHSDKPMGATKPTKAKKPKSPMSPVLKARDGDGDGILNEGKKKGYKLGGPPKTEKARGGGYIARNGGRGSMGSFPRQKDAQKYAEMREEHEVQRSKIRPGDKAAVEASNAKAIEMQHFQGDNMLVPPKRDDWSGKNKKKSTGQRARYHLRGKKMAQSHMTKADLRKALIPRDGDGDGILNEGKKKVVKATNHKAKTAVGVSRKPGDYTGTAMGTKKLNQRALRAEQSADALIGRHAANRSRDDYGQARSSLDGPEGSHGGPNAANVHAIGIRLAMQRAGAKKKGKAHPLKPMTKSDLRKALIP